MDLTPLLQLLPFVLLFGVHHFLVGPLLYKKLWLYLVLTALLLGGFGVYCFRTEKPPTDRPPMDRPALPPGIEPGNGPDGPPGPPPDGKRPIQPQWLELLVGIFLIGGDLGLLAHERMKKNVHQMEILRTESLNQQLESLRYQINPHFFMNTLNNIQSLIYTDPDKATEAVSEFSKLMRIVLYDSEKPTYPLATEMAFLNHYVSLMRLRYPESVHIETRFPEDCEGAEIPPLVLATFVENAFKHGVDYEGCSSVLVSVERTDGKIVFRCENSLPPEQKPSVGGKGLENARRRLNLLYGESHLLQTEVRSGRYCILLVIPQTVKTLAL